VARPAVGLIALGALAVALLLPPHHSLAPPGTVAGARAATIRIPHRWPAPGPELPPWADLWRLRNGSGGSVPNQGSVGTAALTTSGTITSTGLTIAGTAAATIAPASLAAPAGSGDYSMIVLIRVTAWREGTYPGGRFIESGTGTGAGAYAEGNNASAGFVVATQWAPTALSRVVSGPTLPATIALVLSRSGHTGRARFVWSAAVSGDGAASATFPATIALGNNSTRIRPQPGTLIAVGTVAREITDAEAVAMVQALRDEVGL